MKSLVSVIIPAYNAKKTILRMLRCVRQQTYEYLEIIVVNDGSKDCTGELIDAEAKEDNRIHVIHKENGGVGSARNAGLDAATGRYVCFFDADDAVPSTAISRLLRVEKKTRADLVIGKVKMMGREEKLVTPSTERIGNTERIGKYNKSFIGTLSIWNKLFCRNIIEEHHLRFNDTKRGEDSVFLFEYWYWCRHIAGCRYVVYHYEKRNIRGRHSLSQKVSKKVLREMHSNYRRILEIVDQALERDRPALEDDINLSNEEREVKIANQTAFRSLICRKAAGTFINKYYRILEDVPDDYIEKLEGYLKAYRVQMLAEDWETVVAQNADVIDRDGKFVMAPNLE